MQVDYSHKKELTLYKDMAKATRTKTPTRNQKSSKSKAKLFELLAYVFIAFCAIIITSLTYAGGYTLFFTSNPQYQLKQLDFHSDGVIGEELVVKTIQTQKVEGKELNLYAISTQKLRHDLLKAHPAIEDVKVSRQFPEILKVSIQEKPVIARINVQGEQWTLTEKGLVLSTGNRLGIAALPIIQIAGMKKLSEGDIINNPKILKALDMLKYSMVKTFDVEGKQYTFKQILDVRNVFIRKDTTMLIANENKRFRVARNSRVMIDLDEYKISLSRAWRAAYEQSKSRVPYNYIDATNSHVAIRVVNSPLPQ